MIPPVLPSRTTSWFPGHMSAFMKQLPALLTRTDIILELRDARLPLTSINPHFESHLANWRTSGTRHSGSGSIDKDHHDHADHHSTSNTSAGTSSAKSLLCRRLIVLNKKDLVPTWGMRPFTNAMASHDAWADIHFVSTRDRASIRKLLDRIISYARAKPSDSDTNVLVVGMPNVGKSSILNSLRSLGISGKTAKAMQTSALPGKTRVLSTRLKLSETPRVYAYDTPGVMLPYLGRDEHGAEAGIKLALIAGLKETTYDIEVLAHYLLYRLWRMDPQEPPFTVLLPTGTSTRMDMEVEDFFNGLAERLGMRLPGGEFDRRRAAAWFVRWWRDQGGKETAKLKFPPVRKAAGWGFDFDWTTDSSVVRDSHQPVNEYNDRPMGSLDAPDLMRDGDEDEVRIEEKMVFRIAQYSDAMAKARENGVMMSKTQQQKREKDEEAKRRKAKALARGFS